MNSTFQHPPQSRGKNETIAVCHLAFQVAVRVINTTEWTQTISRKTQTTENAVVIPEQSKFSKPVDTAILRFTLEGDLDLTANLNKSNRTNKPDEQNNVFWFPISENPGKNEDRTPTQTGSLKQLHELAEEEKRNSKNDTEFQMNSLKLRWTDTLLMEAEKQAVEDILVE